VRRAACHSAPLAAELKYRKNGAHPARALPHGTPGCNPCLGFLLCLWSGQTQISTRKVFDVL
jgi:hypothetical protein